MRSLEHLCLPCKPCNTTQRPGNIAGAGLARQPATLGTAVRAASTGSSHRQQSFRLSHLSPGPSVTMSEPSLLLAFRGTMVRLVMQLLNSQGGVLLTFRNAVLGCSAYDAKD